MHNGRQRPRGAERNRRARGRWSTKESRAPDRGEDGPEIVQQANFLGNLLHPGPEFAAIRQEVVVGVDEE